MSDEEAHKRFTEIRWADNNGEPVCPRCDGVALYTYRARKLWKCKACTHQFSVTSWTTFASRKLKVRDILLANAIFCNGAKGISALQLSRDLEVQYRTAFVLAHKLRKRWAAETQGMTLSGEVEVDGAYFGGDAPIGSVISQLAALWHRDSVECKSRIDLSWGIKRAPRTASAERIHRAERVEINREYKLGAVERGKLA